MATDTKIDDAKKAEREAAKAEKFVTLARKRVSAALDKIALVRNLANKANYSFTAEQAAKINDALGAAVDAVEDDFKLALEGKVVKADAGFDF